MNPTVAGDPIVQEIAITAPAERVFQALTNPEELTYSLSAALMSV